MAVIGSTWAVLVGAVILYLSWVFLRTFESNPFWIRVEVLLLLRPSLVSTAIHRSARVALSCGRLTFLQVAGHVPQ